MILAINESRDTIIEVYMTHSITLWGKNRQMYWKSNIKQDMSNTIYPSTVQRMTINKRIQSKAALWQYQMAVSDTNLYSNTEILSETY